MGKGSYLFRNMDESNCLGIHCFAEAHDCTQLMLTAKTYVLKHFQVTYLSLDMQYLISHYTR